MSKVLVMTYWRLCYEVLYKDDYKDKRVKNSTEQDDTNKGTKQTQNGKIIKG